MNAPSKRSSATILGSAVALVIAGGGAAMWFYFVFIAQRLFPVIADQLYPESGLEVVAIAALGFFSFTIGMLIGTLLWAITMRSFFEQGEVVAGLRRLTPIPDPVMLWMLRRVYRDEPR